MDRALTRMLIISKVTEMISKELNVKIDQARDMFYQSQTCKTLNDNESGLYGESPYRTFQLFMSEYNRSHIITND